MVSAPSLASYTRPVYEMKTALPVARVDKTVLIIGSLAASKKGLLWVIGRRPPTRESARSRASHRRRARRNPNSPHGNTRAQPGISTVPPTGCFFKSTHTTEAMGIMT